MSKAFLNISVSHITGVVDSEDIPLNLSRELLQNSALIRLVSLLGYINSVTTKQVASDTYTHVRAHIHTHTHDTKRVMMP
jgi:HSP90 family molecular chaperone